MKKTLTLLLFVTILTTVFLAAGQAFAFSEDSGGDVGPEAEFAEKCMEFSSLFYGDVINDVSAPVDFESFLFFTDPHLAEATGWKDRCHTYLSQIQAYYHSTPMTFCLCGGDWLGNSDLPDAACFKLGYIDGLMHSMFEDCHMLAGNHDTNYQGKKDAESERYTTTLSNEALVSLWYRKEHNSYYTFDGANTRFYCFDTGTEGQSMSFDGNHGWDQAFWFANSLLEDNSRHIAIAAHILYYSTDGIQPLTAKILEIVEAYNSRSSVEVNGSLYDYASNTGRIEFGLFGHLHEDNCFIMGGIPCILTTAVRTGPEATFDLVMADYDKRVIHLVRVGSGDSREIPLSPLS